MWNPFSVCLPFLSSSFDNRELFSLHVGRDRDQGASSVLCLLPLIVQLSDLYSKVLVSNFYLLILTRVYNRIL